MYLNDSINKLYEENGYLIIPDIIDSDLVKEVQNHVMWLQNKYPKVRPEAFHHDLLVNDPFIHKLLNNKKFQIKVNKQIPNKAGLGGGSMNAARVFQFFIKNKS